MHIKRGVRGASCADSMKTLALLCVVGVVAGSDTFSGRIAIYGELTLKLLATATLAAWSRVVDCRQWRAQEFCSGGSTNSVEDRGQTESGSGGGSPLVRGSEGSCNLVQKISFHIVEFSQFLVL